MHIKKEKIEPSLPQIVDVFTNLKHFNFTKKWTKKWNEWTRPYTRDLSLDWKYVTTVFEICDYISIDATDYTDIYTVVD